MKRQGQTKQFMGYVAKRDAQTLEAVRVYNVQFHKNEFANRILRNIQDVRGMSDEAIRLACIPKKDYSRFSRTAEETELMEKTSQVCEWYRSSGLYDQKRQEYYDEREGIANQKLSEEEKRHAYQKNHEENERWSNVTIVFGSTLQDKINKRKLTEEEYNFIMNSSSKEILERLIAGNFKSDFSALGGSFQEVLYGGYPLQVNGKWIKTFS